MAAFRDELDAGYYAMVTEGEGHARQVARAAARRRPRDPAPPDRGRVSAGTALPETAAVHWRPRVDAAAPDARAGARWTVDHRRAHGPVHRHRRRCCSRSSRCRSRSTSPCSRTRGRSRSSTRSAARTCVRPKPRAGGRARADARSGCSATSSATTRASCTRAPGLVPSAARSACGWWARPGPCSCARRAARVLLVRPGPEPELPSADRVAHLLLALRADEEGFATVANLAFSGAPWRLRRRMLPRARPALAEARAVVQGVESRAVKIGSTVHGGRP